MNTGLEDESDTRLLHRVHAKGPDAKPALGVLYGRWQGPMAKAVHSILPEQGDEKYDLIHDAVYDVCTNPEILKQEHGARKVAMTVLRRKCYQMLRVVRPESLTDYEAEDREPVAPGPGPVTRAIQADLGEFARKCVEKLQPVEVRQAVRLRFLEEMEIDQIAEELHVDRETIRVRVKKGLQQLKDLMGEDNAP